MRALFSAGRSECKVTFLPFFPHCLSSSQGFKAANDVPGCYSHDWSKQAGKKLSKSTWEGKTRSSLSSS